MKSVGRGRVVAGAVFVAVMFVLAAASVVAHHRWPNVITKDDIPIITGWFGVASTTLAYLSARASRAAASDSRRALLLHFRPESVRVAFSVRDPRDLHGQMPYVQAPSPGVLWLTLTAPNQVSTSDYTVVWVRDDNTAAAPRIVPASPGHSEHIPLEGVSAEEVNEAGSPWKTVARLTQLTVQCQDAETKARWISRHGWPQRQALGSYRLEFELDE